jgi:hypothetical protein
MPLGFATAETYNPSFAWSGLDDAPSVSNVNAPGIGPLSQIRGIEQAVATSYILAIKNNLVILGSDVVLL